MDSNKSSEWKSISLSDIKPLKNQREMMRRVLFKYIGIISLTIIISLAILQLKVTPAVVVTMNNKAIAIVPSKKDFINEFNKLEEKYKKENTTNVKLNSNYNLKYSLVDRKKISTAKELSEVISSNFEVLVNGYGIFVDGQLKVALNTKDEANKVLDELKSQYTSSKEDNIEFNEKVEILEEYVPHNNISSIEHAIELLTQNTDKITDYIVKEGDTLWDISDKNNISVDKLMELNPNKLDKIYPGQTIKLAVPNYVINVKTVGKIEIEEKTPYTTEYKTDDAMYKGDRKVISSGKDGKKAIKLEIVKQNGVEIAKEVIEEKIISTPKTEVIALGTKESDNIFRRPAYGAISSRFGFRWGRTHEGIDISGNAGDPIYAAADGTVIFSGTESGYGNLVKIDHSNGYVTFYGHNTKNLVKVGQNITKGEQVATIGTTGNTTGPHVHFEVRYNGAPVDPMKFLKN